jgi:hypothetical protein
MRILDICLKFIYVIYERNDNAKHPPTHFMQPGKGGAVGQISPQVVRIATLKEFVEIDSSLPPVTHT